MKRPFRNAIIALAAILLIVGAIFYLQRSSGGNSPSGVPSRAKHDEATGFVELSDAKLAAAGIEMATAGPGVLHAGLLINGILQPNQETLVQVTPRFPGIVKDIRRRIGDQVAKGDLLATVESNQSLTAYDLRAPISGTIVDRQVSLGEYASEQKPAFVITDLSTVWVDFSVYRRDLKRVRIGDTIIVDAEDGGPPIEAKISYLSPVGSSETQSALARAVVGNSDLRLRPGLFVTGRLLLATKSVKIVVKSSALQTIENRSVVFVRAGQKFETRNVEVGDRDTNNVEITSGLAEGDIYAAKNSFVIKAELAKGVASDEH